MKHFVSKVKKATRDFFTNKSAFSLVELIVVIAIMAVMAAVLAPALLGYVEKSRMQKDDSAMDEVVNTVQLALADQNIYDEVLEHSVYDNVSCYIDTASESDHADHKVTLKDAHGEYKEQYMFDDEARLLDETIYYAAGNMRGMTVTFSPSDSGDTYDLKNGVINKFVGRKTGYLYENPELYNRVRSTIGDTLETTSQTYRNSDYTLFIRVGSTGGAEAAMQDAVQVWGQFNGTNLAEKDHSYVLATGRVVGAAGANDATVNEQQQDKDDNVIFGENYVAPDPALNPNDGTTPVAGDTYMYGDYTYTYSESLAGWQVNKVADKTKQYYGEILESINGKPIKNMYNTFHGCKQLLASPKIPESVTSLSCTFTSCIKLQTIPEIPRGVTDLTATFNGCKSLVDASSLQIPEGVTILARLFEGCTSLTTAPEIPDNIESMFGMFKNCNKLTGEIVINTNIINSAKSFNSGTCRDCFSGVDMSKITLTGEASKDVLNIIGGTGKNWTPIS